MFDHKNNIKLTYQPLVSVLTPVYNGEKFLKECIESVINQTYQNWEYIIVNNCSTDRTFEIAQSYARKDTRIRVISNDQFLNPLQNHNKAFSLISPESKYCKVVHADDFLFSECLMQMVNVAEENPSVGIVSAYAIEGTKVKYDNLPSLDTVFSGKDICRLSLFGKLGVFGSPTTILIRSEFIRKIKEFYNESVIYADTEACYEVLRTSDLGFVHQVLTYSRVHNEQQSSFARRFNTRLSGKLDIIKKYGPVYLSSEEYDMVLKQKIKDYYKYLAKSIFDWRDKTFWDFHKKAMGKSGIQFNLLRLLITPFCVVCSLFSPYFKRLLKLPSKVN